MLHALIIARSRYDVMAVEITVRMGAVPRAPQNCVTHQVVYDWFPLSVAVMLS